MKKSIYEQSQKRVKWLRDYLLDVFYNERILSDHIQRSTEELDIIRLALQKAEKQEKLLELYKKLATVRDEMLDTWEGDDDVLYDMRDIEVYLKRLIKELENNEI